jgi:hypothetical protein
MMPRLHEEAAPEEGAGGTAGQPSSPGTPLPKNVQEHLGRQLRSTYNAKAERPTFLGDPAVPPQFERLIRRIEVSEKVREIGVEAVRQALKPGAIGSAGEKPETPEDSR